MRICLSFLFYSDDELIMWNGIYTAIYKHKQSAECLLSSFKEIRHNQVILVIYQ